MQKREWVHIAETAPRDGLQNLPVLLPTEAKIALIRAIAEAGVSEIDSGSFVPPHIVPQFADFEPVVARAVALEGVTIGAFIPNVKGAERAVAAGVDLVTFVISASERHNQSNLRRSVEDQLAIFRDVRAITRAASRPPKLVAAVATAFGCSIEGRVAESAVRRLVHEFAEGGADEIALADTVGYANPALIKARVKAVIADLEPDMPVRLHLHDTLGMGLANAYAGLEAGIRRFDSSVSGLGGCPFAPGARGNIVTEDFVFMCHELGFETGIDLEKLMETRAVLATHVPAHLLNGHLHQAGYPDQVKIAARAAL